MKHIILACAFLAVSGAASANWFAASGVTKSEWREMSQEQRKMTKREWAQKWGALSKEEKKTRMNAVQAHRKDSSVKLEKWEAFSSPKMDTDDVKPMKEKKHDLREKHQEKMQDMKEKRQERTDDIKAKHKGKMSDMKAKRQEKIKAFKKKHAERKEEMKEKWQKKKSNWGGGRFGGRKTGGRRAGR